MDTNFCLICQLDVNSHNKIDIQLTTTSLGQVNVEEFLKESILEIPASTTLRSNFLCQQCFAAVNTLEDHFIMYKTVQQTLVMKFYQERSDVNIKHELLEETNEVVIQKPNIFEMALDESKNIPQPEELTSVEEPAHNEDLNEPNDDDDTETNAQERNKSLRKRKEIHNYSEKDEKIVTKKSKKVAGSKECKASKTNTSSKSKEDNKEDTTLPPKPAYCCEICGKQYVNYNGFNIHRRKHKNENLIRCEYCDKTFAQKGGLRRHLHQHTGTFPYQCEICDKKFTHQSSYKIHKDIHEGRRDYICDTCGMAFYSRAHLRSHINRHTKERLHGCDECGATFTEKYNMRVHRLKVHGIKC